MLGTSILHYRISSYVPSSFRVCFTTLFNFYHHLRRLYHSHITVSTLISFIKPCAYRLNCFSDGHQY